MRWEVAAPQLSELTLDGTEENLAPHYDTLVATGAVGSLKRDILVDASTDQFYLVHILQWFQEQAAPEENDQSSACALRLINELLEQDLCGLAAWNDDGTHQPTHKDRDQLRAILEGYGSPSVNPFDYFLVATERGKTWAARYHELITEL